MLTFDLTLLVTLRKKTLSGFHHLNEYTPEPESELYLTVNLVEPSATFRNERQSPHHSDSIIVANTSIVRSRKND